MGGCILLLLIILAVTVVMIWVAVAMQTDQYVDSREVKLTLGVLVGGKLIALWPYRSEEVNVLTWIGFRWMASFGLLVVMSWIFTDNQLVGLGYFGGLALIEATGMFDWRRRPEAGSPNEP